ncbi:MAG: DUF4831 family protein [Bacteroidales bacterium]|nr:DUF4831 family protein [Bacteroidales bacterium]
MKHYLLILAAACVGLNAAAQKTEKLTASKGNDYGLVYTLPKTAVDITVETETTVKARGEFANYARMRLGIDNAVTEPSTRVTVKSITIGTRGVPDSDNRWIAQFKPGSTVSILLDEGGIPLAINADAVDGTQPREHPKAVPMPVSPLDKPVAQQVLTQEMIRSTSLSKKAELAAQRIYELREQRNELISGNVDNMPADGASLKVALDALAEQEEALTAMFAGTTLTGTQVSTFSFVPSSHEVADSVVARISPVDGITDSDDLRGIPLTVSIRVISRGELPVNDKGEAKKFPKGGVAYNIPGAAEITVSFGGKVMGTKTVDLAQLGTTFGIDPDLFTHKKSPMQATFSPITGALLSLEPLSAE